MKVKLVFDRWQRYTPEGIVNLHETPEGIELEMGDFHSGSTFPGSIDLPEYQADEMREAMKTGAEPVFIAIDERGFIAKEKS